MVFWILAIRNILNLIRSDQQSKKSKFRKSQNPKNQKSKHQKKVLEWINGPTSKQNTRFPKFGFLEFWIAPKFGFFGFLDFWFFGFFVFLDLGLVAGVQVNSPSASGSRGPAAHVLCLRRACTVTFLRLRGLESLCEYRALLHHHCLTMAANDIVVTGCQDATLGRILRGTYREVGRHHGKAVYQKVTELINGFDVFCYFWNGADCVTYRGWWFGETVGGDLTVAYHSSPKSKPPRIGWQMSTYAAIDWTMTMSGDGIGMCTFIAPDGTPCSEKAPDDCDYEKCNRHCSWWQCGRHGSAEQLAENQKTRGERANRRRGGKRAWAEHGMW